MEHLKSGREATASLASAAPGIRSSRRLKEIAEELRESGHTHTHTHTHTQRPPRLPSTARAVAFCVKVRCDLDALPSMRRQVALPMCRANDPRLSCVIGADANQANAAVLCELAVRHTDFTHDINWRFSLSMKALYGRSSNGSASDESDGRLSRADACQSIGPITQIDDANNKNPNRKMHLDVRHYRALFGLFSKGGARLSASLST